MDEIQDASSGRNPKRGNLERFVGDRDIEALFLHGGSLLSEHIARRIGERLGDGVHSFGAKTKVVENEFAE